MCEMEDSTQPPAGIQKLRNTCKGLDSEESRMKGINYKPGPNDVIISTSAKTGTTLMQQICHGLRSHGDMNFDEISFAVPCLEMGHDYGYKDLYAKQAFQPQMFKTHLWYHLTPKGAGKYITVVRNPSDVALSFYHFFANWVFEKDEISIQEFIEWFWITRGPPQSDMEEASLFHHIMSWYPHRHDKNVLWLHYEDLKQDLKGCVRLVAQFLDIVSDDEELHELVTKQASIDFMKKHHSQFDEHMFKLARNEAAGLPKNAGMINNPGKVRSGLVNSAKDIIPPSTLAKIDQAWTDVVTSTTAYKTYEDFRDGINEELKRSFV